MADSDIAAAPANAAPKTAAEVVTEWFNECIQNSEVSRNTAAYNAVQAAVEELKARLVSLGK